MDTHKNARLTPKGREEMVRAIVDCGLSKAEAARRHNTTAKTVAKWVNRFRKEGVEGLLDRWSRPLSSPGQTPQAACDAVEALRRQRYTGAQIADQPWLSPATVSRPRAAAHPHQTLYAQDQRQGRTLQPDQPARTGLCQSLRTLTTAQRSAAELAASVQLASPHAGIDGKTPISRLGLTGNNLLRFHS
jgi:transposase-like protein